MARSKLDLDPGMYYYYKLKGVKQKGRVKKKERVSNNSGSGAADYLVEADRVGGQPTVLLLFFIYFKAFSCFFSTTIF